ncbi:MAG: hypothetical protein ACYCTV_01260 [Leptospirales bacterium]
MSLQKHPTIAGLTGLAGFLLLSACSFSFGGGEPTTNPSSSASGQKKHHETEAATPLPIDSEHSAGLGESQSPLGLEPMGNGGNSQSPASQLMSEGTLGYVLDHLFGGPNPSISRAYLPEPGYSQTTAGGMPGGLWPGNWWIQGQGGGYNLTHLP